MSTAPAPAIVPLAVPPARAPAVARWLGLGCGAAAAILFAGKAVLVRLGYAHGADAVGLLGLRMAFSLPCFATLAWWYARRHGPLPHGDRLRLLALGVLGYHLASWLDFQGLVHIDAALERVVLFLYPSVVLGWALLRGKRGVDRRLLLALAATYGGIVLTWGDRIRVGGVGATTVGVLWVAASAIVFALYLILAEDVVARVGGLRAMAVAMLSACATSVAHALLASPAQVLAPTPAVAATGAALAITATVMPVLLSGVALQHLGSARAAVVGCIAPAITALIGWAWLGERLGVAGWAGIAATMIGALLTAKR